MITATSVERIFRADRVEVLNDALDVLTAIRDELAQAAFDAPSDVRSDHPRAQDYGEAKGVAGSVERALTQLLIVAEVNLGTPNLIRELDDDEAGDD